MRKTLFSAVTFIFLAVVVGVAVGALGGYVASRDSIQVDTDKPYDGLWNAALAVAKIRGNIQKEDYASGSLEAGVESSRVWIRLIRMTQASTRLKVSCRKYHMPNLKLAEDIFVKIMDQAR
jgi:head-tail adaptor